MPAFHALAVHGEVGGGWRRIASAPVGAVAVLAELCAEACELRIGVQSGLLVTHFFMVVTADCLLGCQIGNIGICGNNPVVAGRICDA